VIGAFDVNITRDVTDWILVGVSVMTSLRASMASPTISGRR
jgi:hypothetical protein